MDRVDIAEGLSLSRIAYGMWRLTEDDTSPETVRAKIEACLDQGITTMDLADIYGDYEAEAVVGRALTPELRDRIEIVSKCGIRAPVGRLSDMPVKHYDTSRAAIEAAVERTLSDLATDRIDVLLIHRPDPLMDHRETGATLDDLVLSGKVRSVGVSNFAPHDVRLLRSAMRMPLAVNQIELSLAHLAPFTDGTLAHVQEHGMIPMAWSPLGGGRLISGAVPAGGLRTAMARMAAEKGVDLAALAVAWLLRHPAGIVPVMGTNTLSRIERLHEATGIEITREDWFVLYEAAMGREVP